MILSSSYRLAKLSGRYRDLPYVLSPHTCIARSNITTDPQRGPFVTFDAAALVCYHHSESIVYISVHACCFGFYQFGQMCTGHVSTIIASYRVISLP